MHVELVTSNRQVVRHTGFKFNSIVFDCEGCYVPLIRQYKEQIQAMDKVS